MFLRDDFETLDVQYNEAVLNVGEDVLMAIKYPCTLSCFDVLF
jgi:hypothetical protein